MIPKKIHTFWLSGNEIPEWAQANMATWTEQNPEYEVVIHYADEFAELVNTCEYYAAAMNAGEWAFATDYLRCKVLYEEGGWYMDADVVCIKPLDGLADEFGERSYWLSCETPEITNQVETAVMAFEPGNELMGEMISEYEAWTDGDGFTLMPNVMNRIITGMNAELEILGREYFCGLRGFTEIPHTNDLPSARAYKILVLSTENSYTIHLITHTGYSGR